MLTEYHHNKMNNKADNTHIHIQTWNTTYNEKDGQCPLRNTLYTKNINMTI